MKQCETNNRKLDEYIFILDLSKSLSVWITVFEREDALLNYPQLSE